MSKIPKIKDFKTPEGYFEKLPDQIIAKTKQRPDFKWLKYAAAAMILISLGFWQWPKDTAGSEMLALESEVDLYIDSQYWTVEDVLSLSENPNEILEIIIEEEFTFSSEKWEEEDLIWIQ